MLIPRQLAPTVGPAHGGVKFLEGFFPRVREARDHPDNAESALFAAKFSTIGMEGSTSSTNSWNGIY